MHVSNKVIVVTGAGSGIGKALVARFTSLGAKAVIAVDLHASTAQQTASEYDCIAMTADVGKEVDIQRVIDDTEKLTGPIDLFCSNAGVALGADEQSDNSEWQTSWDVNVMAHVYASRHLVPRMVERGNGYFLITASAAGLLNQIGGAAYGTTKHAAVGFAEWLALTYAHQGIKVSMLCPQAVRTPMIENMDDEGSQAAAGDGLIEPEQLADIVVTHLEKESFLILTHEQVREYMGRKATNYDRWIQGMNRLFRNLSGID